MANDQPICEGCGDHEHACELIHEQVAAALLDIGHITGIRTREQANIAAECVVVVLHYPCLAPALRTIIGTAEGEHGPASG